MRTFNRFYTGVLGLLRDGLLDTRYSLTESRVLFELGGSDGLSPSDLAERLRLNLGYVSRVVTKLKEQHLLDARGSREDGRRLIVSLTKEGRKVFRLLDDRASRQIRGLLSNLGDEEQERLMLSIAEIESLLKKDETRSLVVLRAPGSGDYGWVVQRHGSIYAQEFGWDETFEGLVARIVADYVAQRDPEHEAAWIAEVDGARVGCIFCTRKDDDVARLRLLLVDPNARGMGVGAKLIDECIRFARRAGYKRMTLWTNDVLVGARRLYERAGFRLVEENEHHSFGHDLVGQDWLLDL